MLSGVRFLPSDSRASAQTAVSFFDTCKSELSVSSVVRFGFFVACGQPVCAQPLFLISLVAVAEMNSAQNQPPQALPSPRPRPLPHLTLKPAIFVVLLLALLLFARFAGRMLVRDHPEKSDVIVVLAGDSQDERYRRGMELLRSE